MKDPKKLREQRPDYVKDPLETDDMERPPMIGSDPEDLPPGGKPRTADPDDEEEDSAK